MPQGKGTYGNKQGRPAKKKLLPKRKGESAKKKALPKKKGESTKKKLVDMKEKYKGKKFTPLIGRGTAQERQNTRDFASDLESNRKAKNKARLKKVKAVIGKVAKATNPLLFKAAEAAKKKLKARK